MKQIGRNEEGILDILILNIVEIVFLKLSFQIYFLELSRAIHFPQWFLLIRPSPPSDTQPFVSPSRFHMVSAI